MAVDAGVIQRARDHLASGHWIKDQASDGWGNNCAVGALREYANCATYEELKPYIELLQSFVPGGSLVSYNDLPETTLSDIVLVFDKGLAELGAL
jgi:hypothetical protein